MLPIVSIGNLVNFSAYFLVTVLTFLSYRRTKIVFTLYFLRFFVFLTILFFFISFPGIISKTPTSTALVFLASYIWVYPLMANLALIFFDLLKPNFAKTEGLKRSVLLVLLLSLVFTIFIGIYDFKPSELIYNNSFFYWVPQFSPIVRVPLGLISIVLGIFIVASFFNTGFKSGNRKVLKRGMVLGSAMLAMLTSSVVNYIGGATSSPITLLVACVFMIISALLFLIGVFYKID